MTEHLLVLFFCLFLVMIGFGITMPVFAFYADTTLLGPVLCGGAVGFTHSAGDRPLAAGVSAFQSRVQAQEAMTNRWRDLAIQLWPLLALAVQFGLAMFEATFALHAKEMLGYGPAMVGAVFMVCGGVMAVFQGGAVGYLARRMSAGHQIAVGFVLLGGDLAVLLFARSTPLVLTIVGLQALGMALVTPNLTALASKGQNQQTGAALGLRNAANSLGQAGGAAIGGLLFAWDMRAAYSITGVILVAIGVISGSVIQRAKIGGLDIRSGEGAL